MSRHLHGTVAVPTRYIFSGFPYLSGLEMSRGARSDALDRRAAFPGFLPRGDLYLKHENHLARENALEAPRKGIAVPGEAKPSRLARQCALYVAVRPISVPGEFRVAVQKQQAGTARAPRARNTGTMRPRITSPQPGKPAMCAPEAKILT